MGTSTSNDMTFIFNEQQKNFVNDIMDKDKDWMNKIEDGKMSALPTLETPHAGHSHPYTCIPEEASVDSPPNVVGGQPPVGPVGMGKPPTVQEINDGMGKLLQSMNSIDPVTTTVNKIFHD